MGSTKPERKHGERSKRRLFQRRIQVGRLEGRQEGWQGFFWRKEVTGGCLVEMARVSGPFRFPHRPEAASALQSNTGVDQLLERGKPRQPITGRRRRPRAIDAVGLLGSSRRALDVADTTAAPISSRYRLSHPPSSFAPGVLAGRQTTASAPSLMQCVWQETWTLNPR